ncbi:SpoIIE family protein phosphatase [bacterium]|nr:SpoIIE family protein phosphatase [bacterium]
MEKFKELLFKLYSDRRRAEILLPFAIGLIALYFFYQWVVKDRILFIGGFLMAVFFLTAIFTLNFSKASRIAKRVTAYIITGLAFTFLLTGFFFYAFNQSVIRQFDLKNNLRVLESYNKTIDQYFAERLQWANVLRDRLLVSEPPGYNTLINEFYYNHPTDFISIYLLNSEGFSRFGVPVNYDYLERSDFKTVTITQYTEPSVNVSLGQNVETQLVSVKLIVPFTSPDSTLWYILMNLKLEDLTKRVKEITSNTRFYIVRKNEVLYSNIADNSSRDFRDFTETGYTETDDRTFITRHNLQSIPWQTVSVQTLDQAFPGLLIADGELTKVVILCGVLGLLSGLLLSLYLTKSILLPVSKLSMDAGIISRGEIDHPIGSASETDEINDLAASVRTMVNTLKEKMSELNTANERLVYTQSELDQQLQAAHKIQLGLTPHDALLTSGFDIYGRLILAHQVGGDYFDYFEIDEHHAGILLIDAAGKGISASFYAALVKGVTEIQLKSLSFHEQNLSKYFHIIEDLLFHVRDQRTRTVAMQFAVLDTQNGHIRIINAGLENPVLVRDGNPSILNISGRAMGMPRWLGDFQEVEFDLQPNDTLLFHSDGLENLESAITPLLQEDFFIRSSQQLLSEMQTHFIDGQRLSDDIAVVLLRHYPIQKHYVKIESAPDAEKALIDDIGKRMERSGFSETKINDFKIAVREAVVNAVKHGNQYNSSRSVDIGIFYTEKFIEVKIHDYGKGFEWSKIEKPEMHKKLNGEQKAGGWGLHVMQKLVYDWSVHRSDTGNTLCLRMIEN